MDDRVRAIIPGVIDVLNLDEQMLHHYGFYGTFSPAISDYVGYNIPQDSFTYEGQELGKVVDPYTYLGNGRFDDMPKLLINSSGDEFFVPDSAQFYFSDLPGTENYLRYIPNTGHGLNGTDPRTSTLTFYDAVINNRPLPQFSWTVEQDGSLTVLTSTTPSERRRKWSCGAPRILRPAIFATVTIRASSGRARRSRRPVAAATMLIPPRRQPADRTRFSSS